MKIPNPLNARYGFFLLLISLELCFPVTRIPNQTEINNQDKNNEILAWFALSSWPKIHFDIDGNKPDKAGDLVTDSLTCSGDLCIVMHPPLNTSAICPRLRPLNSQLTASQSVSQCPCAIPHMVRPDNITPHVHIRTASGGPTLCGLS